MLCYFHRTDRCGAVVCCSQVCKGAKRADLSPDQSLHFVFAFTLWWLPSSRCTAWKTFHNCEISTQRIFKYGMFMALLQDMDSLLLSCLCIIMSLQCTGFSEMFLFGLCSGWLGGILWHLYEIKSKQWCWLGSHMSLYDSISHFLSVFQHRPASSLFLCLLNQIFPGGNSPGSLLLSNQRRLSVRKSQLNTNNSSSALSVGSDI